MRVAVLGSGITGMCAALALADRGLAVDLYERDSQLISQASYWNEGKIHLGLVYAQDPSRKTANTMIAGALRFRPLLARWIATDVLDRALSDRFVYAVHRSTLIPPAAVEDHFRAIADLYGALRRQPGAEYIAPVDNVLWQRNDARTTHALFSNHDVIASYRTEERSIDPIAIAQGLRSAAAGAPNLRTMTKTTVTKIVRSKGTQLAVVSNDGERRRSETYGAVVNALWHNRIGIDATLGLADSRPVMHRFKVGLHSRSMVPNDFPTVTFVLGPFGDTVNYGHRAYLSWYPACHLCTSRERVPSVPDADVLNSDRNRVEVETLDALSHLLPGQRPWLLGSAGQWEIGGGYITAWGRTGIEDKDSQLHQRFEVGVHSAESYHSVDTGKYTLGPHFAEIACQRVMQSKTVARPILAGRQ